MIGYQYNDGGRVASGRKYHVNDCVVRSFVILTGEPYTKIYEGLAEVNSKCDVMAEACERTGRKAGIKTVRYGVFTNGKEFKKYIKSIGIKKVKLNRSNYPTYTEAYEKYGDCVVSTRLHVAAIVDENLQDTFDSRMTKYYNYIAYKYPQSMADRGAEVWPRGKSKWKVRGSVERLATTVWVLDMNEWELNK